MELAEEVYNLVWFFPKEELYSLSAQLKRSCISIPSNIAEGYSRYTTKDYIRFLYIARGSLSELQTQLLLSVRLNFITAEQALKAQNLSNEIGKMLNAIISKLTPKS